MAKGEKTFSTSGQQIKKFDRKPCPPGKYDLKLMSGRAEIKKAESGRVRVSVAFEALKSNKDGKNYWVFNDFHLGLKPGKDGVIMANRGNGISAFCQAAGKKMNAPIVEVTVTPDPKNDPDTTVQEEALSAKYVLDFLKGLDGVIVSGEVKHERRQSGEVGPDGKPVVDARIGAFEVKAAEADEEDEDEEENDEDEDTDEDESDDDEDSDDEDSEDADDDDDDEDEEPAKKPAKNVKKKGKK